MHFFNKKEKNYFISSFAVQSFQVLPYHPFKSKLPFFSSYLFFVSGKCCSISMHPKLYGMWGFLVFIFASAWRRRK
jgi:hypothetical protein